MPILLQEPSIYPETLFDQLPDLTQADHSWIALYTLPKCDKLLIRKLYQQKISFYSPIVEKKSISPSGRKRISYLPLFPNYVFLYGSDVERLAALKSNLVLKTLAIHDQTEFLQDITTLKRLIDTGLPVTLEAKLEPGQRVRILRGSMAGTEGVITERRGKNILVVSINFLQQGASVLVDDFVVEKLEF